MLLSLLIACCAQDGGAPNSAPAGALDDALPRHPEEIARDVDACERAAEGARRGFRVGLLKGLAQGDWERVTRAFEPDARGRLPRADQGRPVSAAGLELTLFEAGGLGALERADLVAALRSHFEDWDEVRRATIEIDAFVLAEDHSGALASLHLTVAGSLPDGGLAVLEADLSCELVAHSTTRWTIARVLWVGGHSGRGGAPAFADVSGPMGFHFNLSEANRALTRELVNERALDAAGGVSVMDWNRDGLPDLFLTRHRQASLLLLNDGRGGFERGEVPFELPADSPASVAFVDLDGDDLEELVSGRVRPIATDRARVDLWTRVDGTWTAVEGALEFAVGRGVRDLDVQSIVPADFDGDGRLDLFFCVLSDSRTEREAPDTFATFDGGDNLLFINRGGLAFDEQSDERGIAGRQLTRSALALDVDGDGDQDLIEGNDRGPDRLHENLGNGHFEAHVDHPLSRVLSNTTGITLEAGAALGSWDLYLAGTHSSAAGRIVPALVGLPAAVRAAALDAGSGGRLLTVSADGSWSVGVHSAALARAGRSWAPLFVDLDNDGTRELLVQNGGTTHSARRAPDWDTYHWRQVVMDALAAHQGTARDPITAGRETDFSGSHAGRQRDRLFLAVEGAPTGFVDVAPLLGLDLERDGRSAAAIDFDGDGDLDLALLGLQDLRLLENRAPPAHFARVSLRASDGASRALGAVVTLTAGGVTRRGLVRATDGYQSAIPAELHFGLGTAEGIEHLRVEWPGGEVEEWSDLPVDRRLVLREGEGEVHSAALEAWPAGWTLAPTDPSLKELSAIGIDGVEAWVLAQERPTVVVFIGVEDSAGARAVEREATRIGSAVRFVAVRVEPDDGRWAERAPGDTVLHLRADDELLRACFPPDGRALLPSTFVFAATGGLRRAVAGSLDVARLEPLLDSLEEEPECVADLLRLGRWHARHGRAEDALDHFRRALAVDADLPVAHNEVGKLWLGVGEIERSEARFAKAAALDPDFAEAQFNLGAARVRLGRPAQALAPLHAAWRVRGDELAILLALGNTAALAGDSEQALEVLATAAGIFPESAACFELRGLVLKQVGRIEEARAHLRRALDLDGNLERAREALEDLAGH